MRGRWRDRLGAAAVAALIAAFVVYLIAAPAHFHWDLRVYYRAAQAWRDGGDPYAHGYAAEIGFVDGALPFVYPPLALVLFAPLTLVPESAAAIAWLVIQLAAVAALVATWRRFVPVALDARTGLVLLLAFNAAIYTGLASGNVAVLEALAVYAAFDALLRERPGRFAALVVAAAAVKVVPVVFLAALLAWGGPRRGRVLAAAVVAVAALVAITAWIAPDYLHAATAQLDERRWSNPTVLAMLRDLADRTGVAFEPAYTAAALALVVLGITGVRIHTTRPPARVLVPLVFVVAALVLPRFKSYSYVELVPAALVALRACRGPGRIALAALLCVVLPWSYLLVAAPAWCASFEHAMPVSRYVWGYTPLAGAFAVWLVYLIRVLPARAR